MNGSACPIYTSPEYRAHVSKTISCLHERVELTKKGGGQKIYSYIGLLSVGIKFWILEK